MKKITIFNHEPLIQRNYQYYQIDELISLGYEVEYISLNNCYTNIKYNNILDSPINKEVQNYKELSKLLINYKECTCFLELPLELKTLKIFILINKHFSLIIKTNFFYQTFLLDKNSFKNKLFDYFYRIFDYKAYKSFVNLINRKLAAIVTNLLKIRLYDIVFTPGTSGHLLYEKVCNINHPDYENRKNVESVKRKYEYSVFLDCYLPYHPDLEKLNQKSINPEVYFCKMNKIFQRFENQIGTKIIVAAHPKAKYVKNEFLGREVLYGKTINLVKGAKYVLTHNSLSINFALIFGKPIYLILLNEFVISKGYEWNALRNDGRLINILSDIYKCPIITENSQIDTHLNSTENYELTLKEYLVADNTKNNAQLYIEYIERFYEKKRMDNIYSDGI